jgi:20S proteasome alpha/beta subunit
VKGAYQSRDMSTEQLIRLAYFTLQEVAKQDLRVRAPIDVAVVLEGIVKILSNEQLDAVKQECDEISSATRSRFLAVGPHIEGLI